MHVHVCVHTTYVHTYMYMHSFCVIYIYILFCHFNVSLCPAFHGSAMLCVHVHVHKASCVHLHAFLVFEFWEQNPQMISTLVIYNFYLKQDGSCVSTQQQNLSKSFLLSLFTFMSSPT